MLPESAPKHKSHGQHQPPMTTIRCFTFLLDQNEFQDYNLNSAKMFIKFDETVLDQFFLPSLALKLVEQQQQNKPGDSLFTAQPAASSHHSFKPFIYVEVNGRLVKKINLVKLLITEAAAASAVDTSNTLLPVLKAAASVDVEDSTEATDSEDTEHQSSAAAVFEYVDLRDLIQQTLGSNKKPNNVLNVRILLSNDLLNYTKSSEHAESLFSSKLLEEHVALNVKFGERIAPRHRAKRQLSTPNGTRRYQSKHNQQAHQQLITNRSHRDCSELRKVGFTSSNFSCCREVLTFSMEQLGWSHWILSPKTIDYKYCRGGCFSNETNIILFVFCLVCLFGVCHLA